ncbi:hypothetical protein BB560_006534 [Smittium megazygosporum]|uniref:Uncharacterized protein n=1 Tax=Smittium megazygosporum TaxID=133381 RepID=A0A2T9Y4H6_9FUNG|nr:hypothetical protein BB560_006534 [Smittium megazygosporum]
MTIGTKQHLPPSKPFVRGPDPSQGVIDSRPRPKNQKHKKAFNQKPQALVKAPSFPHSKDIPVTSKQPIPGLLRNVNLSAVSRNEDSFQQKSRSNTNKPNNTTPKHRGNKPSSGSSKVPTSPSNKAVAAATSHKSSLSASAMAPSYKSAPNFNSAYATPTRSQPSSRVYPNTSSNIYKNSYNSEYSRKSNPNIPSLSVVPEKRNGSSSRSHYAGASFNNSSPDASSLPPPSFSNSRIDSRSSSSSTLSTNSPARNLTSIFEDISILDNKYPSSSSFSRSSNILATASSIVLSRAAFEVSASTQHPLSKSQAIFS